MVQKKLKILFFSPHAAIWVHAFPEALIAEALQQSGHQIIYITCGGQFKSYCIAMSANGIAYESTEKEKERVCLQCKSNKNILKESFKVDGYDLDERLTLSDVEETKKILKGVTNENYLDLMIDDINIGRIALYQFLLQHKKNKLVFSEFEWKRYLIELENTLYSFFACRKIIETEKPDRVITYNSLYSVNHVCHQLAEKLKIMNYFIHASGNLGNRLENLLIGKNNSVAFYTELLKHWEKYRSVPCPRELCKIVTDHFVELLKGKNIFAYSSPKSKIFFNIRQNFGIEENQKILTATMSSYDERFAVETINVMPPGQGLMFSDQIAWIQELIRFLRSRPDLFLIIRVHPREFPNKRESVVSEQAEKLKEVLDNLPKNVKVNWPTDQISLYDLAEVTDVFLNAWSGVGKEMSLFGLPVVIYSPNLIFYPPDLNYVATTRDEYFSKIDLALKEGWNFEKIRQTYRWFALEYGYSVISISDSFKRNKNVSSSLWSRIYSKIMKSIFPFYNEIKDCERRSLSLRTKDLISQLIEQGETTVLDIFNDKSSEKITLEQESGYLKEEIRRLINAMYDLSEPIQGQNSLRAKLIDFI